MEGPTCLPEYRPRSGRPKWIAVADEAAVVALTLEDPAAERATLDRPPDGGGDGPSSRDDPADLAAHGITPHRATLFKLARDPQFVAKLREVVGLYFNPLEGAVARCGAALACT